jgi:ribosomal protein S18 acetylase RimI-like enzyme
LAAELSQPNGDRLMNYELVEKLPSAEEYNQLRQSVGWHTYETDVIVESMPNSLYGVCAFVNTEIVGMARVIGDGGLVYYIQDVIVKPDCQRQGIGTKMMDKVMEYIHAHARNGSIVGLMSAIGKEPFYERYGFIRRPNDRWGCGMMMLWKTDQPART